jgi:hypothetical protein
LINIHSFHTFLHVVNPQDVGTSLHEANGVENRGAVEGFLSCGAQQFVNHAFARNTYEDR